MRVAETDAWSNQAGQECCQTTRLHGMRGLIYVKQTRASGASGEKTRSFL
jgi:hypothetical protein